MSSAACACALLRALVPVLAAAGAASGSAGTGGDCSAGAGRPLTRHVDADALEHVVNRTAVRRVAWHNDSHFAVHAEQRDVPAVFTGTPYANSSVPQRTWSAAHIAGHLRGGVLENVKRYPAESDSYMFPSDMPMVRKPGRARFGEEGKRAREREREREREKLRGMRGRDSETETG